MRIQAPVALALLFFLAAPFAVRSQSASSLVERRFAQAADSLRGVIVSTRQTQRAFLQAMRSVQCDSTERWGFTERVMEVRMGTIAHIDTLLTLNERLLAEDPQARLFPAFDALDPAERMLTALDKAMAELLALCFDGSCRQNIDQRHRSLVKDRSMQDRVLNNFYNVPASALNAVLLKYTAEVEQATLVVLESHAGQCP